MRRLTDKVFCQCEASHCFLEKDAAWCRQNLANSEHDFWRDVGLFNSLEAERLRQKDEWMSSLDVVGTIQVCCRIQADLIVV